MSCKNCVATKDKSLAYTRCEDCKLWRPLTAKEKAKIDRRKK